MSLFNLFTQLGKKVQGLANIISAEALGSLYRNKLKVKINDENNS